MMLDGGLLLVPATCAVVAVVMFRRELAMHGMYSSAVSPVLILVGLYQCFLIYETEGDRR